MVYPPREPMFFPEPIEYPLRRVPLLGRPLTVVLQDSVDDADPWPQPRPLHRLLPLIARREPKSAASSAPSLAKHQTQEPPLAGSVLHQHRTTHPTV